MARVLPFRAVRYARHGEDLTPLTAKPYDCIDADLRADLLMRDPHNVVALELPEGHIDAEVPGNRYEVSGRLWRRWLETGVLAADPDPRVYVLEQRYRHNDADVARRGFIAAVGLEPFSEGVVLPHERTLPKSLDDRLNLTRATAANLSPVFGMFADPARDSDRLIEKAMLGRPLATAIDDEGVVSTVWALSDPSDHLALADLLADERIFIADGHHRYTTALAYRDERRAADGLTRAGEPLPAYETVMMALVNMDDPGLLVYPTHRLADAPAPLDPAGLWRAMSEYFELTDLPAGHPAIALSGAAERPSFIVRTRDCVTKLARLREDVDVSDLFPATASAAYRQLDVSILQALVLSPLLDIDADRPETLDRLAFSKDAHAALGSASEHDAVFILNPTRMDQVAAVALAGETMPQKSTYFYPKLLSGLLFKTLERL